MSAKPVEPSHSSKPSKALHAVQALKAADMVVDSPRAAALKTLAQIREAEGRVPEQTMAEYAASLNMCVGHLRRLLRQYRATGRVPNKPHGNPHKIELPNPFRAQVLYFLWKGNAAKTYEALGELGELPARMDLRTFQRRVNEWDPALRACARFGYHAMVKHQFFNVEHIPYRGYAFGTDHTLLPIMVLNSRGSTTPVWPWLTTVIDLKSRVVLAYKLTTHTPKTEDSLDALVEAVHGWYTEDDVFVGGRPEFIRSDRGGDYIAHALALNLINLDIARQFTEPYSSWQNGRVERINGTLDTEFAPGVPGFHPGGEAEYTRRALKTPLKVESLITVEALDRRIGDFFGDYNNRPHSRLNGLTPLQAWAEDTQPVVRADEGTIVNAMTRRSTRRLQRYGIEVRGTIYSGPFLARLRRENIREVEVRYHDHDPNHIKVLVDGVYEGTATKSEVQSEHERLGVLSVRAAQRRLMERLTRAADYERVLNERERLREEGVAESEWPALPDLPDEDDGDDGSSDFGGVEVSPTGGPGGPGNTGGTGAAPDRPIRQHGNTLSRTATQDLLAHLATKGLDDNDNPDNDYDEGLAS